MISTRASAALAWVFERALCETSAPDAQDRCIVTVSSARHAQGDTARRQLVLINISSYLFRIVAVFDFEMSAQNRAHLARIARNDQVLISEQAWLDACGEFANMICGAANRSLGEAYLLGMSTPFFLESSCAQHLPLLNPIHEQTFEIVIPDKAKFHLTLCVCAAADEEIDFDVERHRQEEVSQGALELF